MVIIRSLLQWTVTAAPCRCMALLIANADWIFWNLGEAMIVLIVLSVEMIMWIIPSLVAALKSGNPCVCMISPLVAWQVV